MKKGDLPRLALALLLCLAAGWMGSLFTGPVIDTWYAALAKPAFNPPNTVFAPVWTILFMAMAVAAFLIWRRGINARGVRSALLLFIGQLTLNMLWSIVFFGWQSPYWALWVIIALWLAIAATFWRFWRLEPAAGLLLLPYLAWVSFATLLNYQLWLLN